MSEETNTEEKEVETIKKVNVGEQASNDLIHQANAAAKRMEDATDKLEETMKKTAQAHVERLLGGETTAGEPEKVESASEYSKRIMEGGQDVK